MSVVVDGTNGLVFNDASTQTTAASGFGFKNRIINGAMMIDQRNAGNLLAGAVGNIYGVDRFNTGVFGSGTGRINVQRSTNAPTGFTNSLINTVGTADAAPSTNYGYCVQHKIEGYNVSDLGFGAAGASPVTVTFWVKSSIAGSYVFTLQNEATDQAYSVSYSINASNVWEQKTITFVGSTTGTWPRDNTSGMVLNWGLGGGSVRVASLNSWYAPAGGWTPTAMSGGVNWIGTSGATFQITGVQLEKGPTATSFDYRPYGFELSLCQRYYIYNYKIFCQQGTSGYSQPLPLTMRAAPTATRTGICQTGSESVPTTSTDTNYMYIYNASLPTGGTFTLSAEL
jgi:hypothetical protein